MSGADEIAATYALELKVAGHSTSVLLVHHPGKKDPLTARLRAAEVPLHTLASTAFSASLAAGRKLGGIKTRNFLKVLNFTCCSPNFDVFLC